MSASLQAQPRDLGTAVSETLLFPVGVQTPVAATETRRSRSTWVRGMSFVTATAVLRFMP